MIDANPKSEIQNPKSEEPKAPIRLPVFEGPLDLLLHLIRQHKVDIYDIPIAQVTEQYVAYLRLMEAMDVDLAGEFLVMAATLMEIKSRLLLPKPPPPEGEEGEEGVDPRQELIDRLLEYQRYKEAAGVLQEMEEERRRCYTRGGLVEFEPGPSIAIDPESAAVSLLLALRRLLEEADKREDVPPTLRRDRMTLRLKMREVWAALQDSPDGMVFEALFRHGGGREEVIATFLAILELLRGGKIHVAQREPLGPILVKPV